MYKGISVYKSEVITDSGESIHKEKFQLLFLRGLILKGREFIPELFPAPQVVFHFIGTGALTGCEAAGFSKIDFKTLTPPSIGNK
jgi:hypothetical protein